VVPPLDDLPPPYDRPVADGFENRAGFAARYDARCDDSDDTRDGLVVYAVRYIGAYDGMNMLESIAPISMPLAIEKNGDE
jgi:hypothetical protein